MHAADKPASQNPTYKDEWLTPPEIIEALGPFDLDPCAPIVRPRDTAARHFTLEDDGLMQPWEGRVWLNPPYGKHTWKWLNRLALHGQGITIIFARTETEGFQRFVWGLRLPFFSSRAGCDSTTLTELGAALQGRRLCWRPTGRKMSAGWSAATFLAAS